MFKFLDRFESTTRLAFEEKPRVKIMKVFGFVQNS